MPDKLTEHIISLLTEKMGIPVPGIGSTVLVGDTPYIMIQIVESLPGMAQLIPQAEWEEALARGSDNVLLLTSTWAFVPELFAVHERLQEMAADPECMAQLMTELETSMQD